MSNIDNMKKITDFFKSSVFIGEIEDVLKFKPDSLIGIDAISAESLAEEKIYTVEDLANISVDSLPEVKGILPQILSKWVKIAKIVEKGVKEALQKGVLAEYPVVDISVNLYDGSFHSVDSSEMAFKIAGSMAFKKAMQEASPVILEPIMELEIIVPEKYMGDIIGDINAKRGKIISMTPTGNKKQLIKASVPQSETFNYTIDLTSLTQGRGRFTQKFSSYEELPPNLAQKVMDERKSKKDE